MLTPVITLGLGGNIDRLLLSAFLLQGVVYSVR